MNDYREKETPPLREVDQDQEMFDFTSLFSIKEASNLTQAEWFFGAGVCHLLEYACFANNSNSFLSLMARPVAKQYRLGLGNNVEE